MITHNTRHYEQRIEELQYDLREREERLKECRLKIIDLKKGNIVLQEAMVEKERIMRERGVTDEQLAEAKTDKEDP